MAGRFDRFGGDLVRLGHRGDRRVRSVCVHGGSFIDRRLIVGICFVLSRLLSGVFSLLFICCLLGIAAAVLNMSGRCVCCRRPLFRVRLWLALFSPRRLCLRCRLQMRLEGLIPSAAVARG